MNSTIENTAEYYQTRIGVISAIFPSIFLTTIAVLHSTLITTVFKPSKKNRTKIFFFSDFFIIVVSMILYYMPIMYRDVFYIHSFVLDTLIGYSLCLIYNYLKPNEKRRNRKDVDESEIKRSKLKKSDDTNRKKHTKRRNFITNIRSGINILTAISILAVDFKTFPGQFMKTIDYGYSLMDVGVGLYVFSNGIVAPEIHDKTKETFSKSITRSSLLIILGLLRFILTRTFNYSFSEHEYGLHWNFFMTLAFTKICCSFILNYLPFKNKLIISVMLLTTYEVVLNNGLGVWILSDAPRVNFIAANREGIFSIIGYVSLYFASISIGKLFNKIKPNKGITSLGTLLLVSTSLYIGTCVLDCYFGVSRRMANAGYCTWILFFGTSMGFVFLVLEKLINYFYKLNKYEEEIHTSLIIEAVNYNGLPFFLLANVLTGMVNLCFKPSEINPEVSVLILIVYMLINCLFVTVLYKKKIKIKLFF